MNDQNSCKDEEAFIMTNNLTQMRSLQLQRSTHKNRANHVHAQKRPCDQLRTQDKEKSWREHQQHDVCMYREALWWNMNRKNTQYINQPKESVASNSKNKIKQSKASGFIKYRIPFKQTRGQIICIPLHVKEKIKNISFKNVNSVFISSSSGWYKQVNKIKCWIYDTWKFKYWYLMIFF